MDARLRILIIGGYGTFGRRLVRQLASEHRLELLIAGRDLAAATRACNDEIDHGALAIIRPVCIDRNGDIASVLRTEAPAIVVDMTGPFQGYGDNAYRVVRTVIDAGADYLDIADSTAFVANFAELDEHAKQRGVVALSGLSTCPTLTGAMVRAIDTSEFSRVTHIEGGIAPSPRATLGRAVIEAIASYAGKPVALTTRSGPSTALGLVDQRRFSIIAPGSRPLPNRVFSLVDVPDLVVLPPTHPDRPELWFGVSTPPLLLQRMLQLAARVVHWKILPSLLPFVGVIDWGARTLRRGPNVGGLTVRVHGRLRDASSEQEAWRSLSIIAEGDLGPNIPILGIVALIEKRLASARPQPGARMAVDEVTFADYARLFDRLGITYARHTSHTPNAELPLYPALLGDAFARLPAAVQRLHAFDEDATHVHWRGSASVERGSNVFANIVARIIGFPTASPQCAVEVELTREVGTARRRETWRRTFAGKTFQSHQDYGTAPADEGVLIERFGPLGFRLAIVTDKEQLRLVPLSWRAFGLRMPKFLMPNVTACEHAADGRFNFDVRIGLPIIGDIVHYRGHLARVGADGATPPAADRASSRAV